MKRTKNKPIKHRDVVDGEPLANDSKDAPDSPGFIDKLEAGLDRKRSRRTDPLNKASKKLKFKNAFMRQVYHLAKLGARDSDVALFFGVSTGVVASWREHNVEFQEAWQAGQYLFGFRVSETLGRRALGYDYKEEEYSQHVDRYGEIRNLKKVTYKHMPPDTTAIIFYLKNRHKDSWSDVNRTEIENKLQIDIAKRLDINLLSDEEQKLIKQIAIKQVSSIHGVSNN